MQVIKIFLRQILLSRFELHPAGGARKKEAYESLFFVTKNTTFVGILQCDQDRENWF